MKAKDMEKNHIKVLKIVPVFIFLVLFVILLKGEFSEKKIDDIVHRYDGEDRYAGKYVRMTVEEQLDYMILKYSGSLEQSRFESEEADAGSGNVISEDDVEADDSAQVREILKNALYMSESYVAFTAPDNISDTDIFTMIRDDLVYDSGEHGILLENIKATWQREDSDRIRYRVEFQYSRSRQEIESIKEETKVKTEQALSRMKLEGKSEFQKADEINEYICDTVEYPESQPYSDVSHTAYGAFAEHSAVCDGYARAVKILCEQAGLECEIVTGKVKNGEGHAWNIVRIDGRWYQWDACWNDGGYDTEEYFLVTDSFMDMSRVWDYDRYPDISNTPYIR